MLQIYNINSINLYLQHGREILDLLEQSPHASKFKSLDFSARDYELGQLILAGGLMLYCARDQDPQALMIVEIRNGIEFGVLELFLKETAPVRLAQLLFDQLVKKLKKRRFRAIYCDMDWYRSVDRPEIRDLFVTTRSEAQGRL